MDKNNLKMSYELIHLCGGDANVAVVTQFILDMIPRSGSVTITLNEILERMRPMMPRQERKVLSRRLGKAINADIISRSRPLDNNTPYTYRRGPQADHL